MPRRPLLLLIAASLLWGTADAEEIKPQLGLSWGESAERIEKLLAKSKARIVARRPLEGGMEAWDVEGLVSPGLKGAVFSFRKNAAGYRELVEAEYQYRGDDWDERRYDEFMSYARQAFQRKFGEGSLIARSDTPVGDVVQRLVGYKWTQNNAAIELFYYSAQNGQNVFRMISVHYKSN